MSRSGTVAGTRHPWFVRTMVVVALVVTVASCGAVTSAREEGRASGSSTRSVAPATQGDDQGGDRADARTTGPRRFVASGRSVAGVRLGTDQRPALRSLTERLGRPDVVVEPRRWSRVEGEPGFFQVAGDPFSPAWRYRVTGMSCWQVLCVLVGGDTAGSVALRGWELSGYRRWSDGQPVGARRPDVRLAGSGLRLGDTWADLHAAYPSTTVAGGEGASLTVHGTPWPVVSDGVGGWRLSGVWDPERPAWAPPGARVTRLSGGVGPELRCC